ncbi:cilia- and flagella-associated protein 74 isoform X3 [Ictalurus furcatus]|uniref:cilia- and flagella-associated protein 74 isoform X3 n=1 Tax=Ictalurus furcatus TaxID=66913 RepID=UPI002350613A|nr:cilia- and flagella-associated protein 74 isoform X3 [Ictalurus furcatus]
MDNSASEDFAEREASEHEAPQNNWTKVEKAGTWEAVSNDEDGFPADYSVDMDDPEWDVSLELGDMEPDEREKSNMDSTRMFKLRSGLDQLDHFYQQKELNVLKAREELKACRLHVTELEKQRDNLENDIEREKQAENSAAVFRLRARHKCVCAELQSEEELEAHLAMVLQEHELELCEVEVELGQYVGLRQELEHEEKKFQALKQEKYTQRLQREKSVEKGAKLKALRAKNEQEKALQEQAELDLRKQDQIRACQKKAAVFLKQTLKRMHEKEEEREKMRKELMKRRMEAAESLKANIVASQEAVRVRKLKEKACLQKQKEEENSRKQLLQEAGMNSIKLMHLHKAQEDLQRKQEEFQARQKARQMEIVSKLLLEEEQKERLNKRHVLLIHPPPRVTQSMALKRREQRLLQNLLPLSAQSETELSQDRHPTRPVSSPASSRTDISSSLDSMEKQGKRTSIEADWLMEGKRDQECLVQPEFTGLWDHKHRDYTIMSDEDIPLKTSLLRSLKTGPDKILTSKGTKKTTSGKELKGPSFVSKPETVLFKDFDLERTYKRKVVLTNISNVTNYCRLVGVSQNLVDFISVSFEPPGPMSAGMSCELETVFKPLLNEDLDGEIQFQSSTGPFFVPIKCRTKKCEMVVDSSLIDFGTHVVGETISRVITLTNMGALGTRYSLAPLFTNCLQLHNPLQHSTPSEQEPGDNSSVEGAALCLDETIQPERENTNCITQMELKSGTSQTSCDTPVGVEASGANGLEERVVTEVEQDHDSEITEISIGKVLEGEVGPFASIKLPIVFTPTIPGENKLDIKISFSQPNCEAIVVSSYGVAESAPVWVTKPSMDLKICMYDRLYQDCIEVQSRASTALRLTFEVYKELKNLKVERLCQLRASTALKLTFQVCKELKNHMDILPKTGYVQAKSSFHAQLKFLPRCSLPEDAKSFFDQDTGVLEVPLNIQVADQVKPVPFTVHAVVTISDLKFDHTEVEFGHCTVFESVQTTVHLTNLSLLPQNFGFVGIPKTLEIDLIFNASKAGEYNFQLTCKSGINRVFQLPCRAIGVRPVLELSNSLVQFGATAVGDRSTAVLYVLNSHTSLNDFTRPMPRIGKGPVSPVGARFFTFIPPENSEITVTPTSGRVLPGQRCLVQVTFNPLLSDDVIKAEAVQLLSQKDDLQNKNEIQEEPKKGKKPPLNHNSSKLKEKTREVSLTPKSESPLQALNPEDIQKDSHEYRAAKASLLRTYKERCSRYVIPCFVSSGDITHKKETKEPLYSPYNTLYLELHCEAVRPMLMVISDNGETTINFNQVAVGQKVLRKVTVQNICSEFVKLKSSLLDLNGPFTVLNAMRGVRPGETHTLLLAFKPALGKKYREILEVSCSKMTLEFTLCGEGIKPLVTCAHEGQILDFGYVLEKQSTSQVLTLQNSSTLLVQFKVLLDSLSLSKHSDTRLLPAFLTKYSTPSITLGTQNYSGQSVFSVSPTEGTIAPGKTQDITVMFQPDHEGLLYLDALHVQLMNHQTVCDLELWGAAKCYNMFVCGGDPLDLCSESLIHPNIYSAGKTANTEKEKLPTPLLLTLRSVYREGQVSAAVRELEVGCIHSSQPHNKKNGEFLWENVTGLQQHGFSVDPTKGSVDAGHRRTITVAWTPPAGHTPNKVVQMCVPLILRGDETEVYSVTLLAYTSHHTHSEF